MIKIALTAAAAALFATAASAQTMPPASASDEGIVTAYNPATGRVVLDGTDAFTLAPSADRSQIAVGQQIELDYSMIGGAPVAEDVQTPVEKMLEPYSPDDDPNHSHDD